MMLIGLWNAVVYQPLHNLLIATIALLPGNNVGVAVIAITVLVKTALYPLSGKSIEAQRKMREIEPELKQIKEKYGDNKQEIAKKTMELYQKYGVTPFSGCLPILIQLPVIIGLYVVFLKGLSLDPAGLYAFTPTPTGLNMSFLGIDLAGKSALLAIIAGVSQYIQAGISMPEKKEEEKKPGEKPSFQEDFAKSMRFQMRYVFPAMITVIAYQVSAAVALYWATSNILSIAQEKIMRRKEKA